MSTMKAIQVPHAGGAFELVERPLPEPEAGQVRIKACIVTVKQEDAQAENTGAI